jgi:formate-dependent nitrite reductase cytochrome c552 subunit
MAEFVAAILTDETDVDLVFLRAADNDEALMRLAAYTLGTPPEVVNKLSIIDIIEIVEEGFREVYPEILFSYDQHCATQKVMDVLKTCFEKFNVEDQQGSVCKLYNAEKGIVIWNK